MAVTTPFAAVEDAIEEIREGRMVVVVDDPDRENGGGLERIGQTEASVDLARLAGLNPSGVVCEIMNEDGTMARVDDLIPYCERHGLKMITVADLVEYRRRREKLVERGASTRLPTL